MTPVPVPPGDLPPLLNRERAILAFNRRVLAQAGRDDVPLLERLRYITIVSSNMDEFFEVRFADAIGAMREAMTGPDAGSDPQRDDLRAVAQEAHALIDAMYAVFNDGVMPALQQQGIRIINHAERSARSGPGWPASSSVRCSRCCCRSAWTRRTRSRWWPTRA
jgi:polyphosphate kinase